MKIIAVADLHGRLPEIEPCDLLLIGGDSLPMFSHSLDYQRAWSNKHFYPWLDSVPADEVVGIGGNHDFLFESDPLEAEALPWTYASDRVVEVGDLRIYGHPWVPYLPNWAFHGESAIVNYLLEEVPEGIDILLSHGPPYKAGTADQVLDGEHVGCPDLRAAVNRIKPKAIVCGHIHEGYGEHRIGVPSENGGSGTAGYEFIPVYNVAHNNVYYEPVNAPVEIEL